MSFIEKIPEQYRPYYYNWCLLVEVLPSGSRYVAICPLCYKSYVGHYKSAARNSCKRHMAVHFLHLTPDDPNWVNNILGGKI